MGTRDPEHLTMTADGTEAVPRPAKGALSRRGTARDRA